MNALDDRITFCLMKEEKRRAEQQMKRFPGRWENMSHYLRSAMIVFNRKLDMEHLDAEYQAAKVRREKYSVKPKKAKA